MRSRSLSTNGFTLVELMIAVAIIGILVSIATASYKGYTYRARQTEAKVALSALYSAETSFYVENGSFTVCIKQAGYSPTLGSTNYFFSGFNQVTALLATCGPTGTSPCNIYNSDGGTCLSNDVSFGDPQTASDIGYAPNGMMQVEADNPLLNEAEAVAIPSSATLFPFMQVSMSTSSFKAGAAGIDAQGHCTGLTIDDRKNLDYPACQ